METNTTQNIADLLKDRIKLEGMSVSEFVDDMFATIRKGLQRDRQVKIKGLGTFKLVDVDARESISINTGERMLIEGHEKVTFVPDPTMKELVNKPFSQFDTVVLNDGVVFNDETPDENLAVTPVPPSTDNGEPILTIRQPEAVPEKDKKESISSESAAPVLSAVPTYDMEEPVIPSEKDVVETKIAEAPLETTETPETEIPAPEEPKVEPETEPEKESEKKSEEESEQEPAEKEVEHPQVTNGERMAGNATNHIMETEVVSASAPRKSSHVRSIVWHSLGCLVLIGASAFGGFEYGVYHATQQDNPSSASPSLPATPPAPSSHQKKTDEQVETGNPATSGTPTPNDVNTEKKLEEEQKDTQKPEEAPKSAVKNEKTTVQPVEKSKEKLNSKAVENVAASRYDSDARVRTGAYRIVGINSTTKAKAGETVVSLSDRTLGPGMECYIEVYNGFSGNIKLAPGQAVKIPKLELKKRKAAK